jgi:hypothetical protein
MAQPLKQHIGENAVRPLHNPQMNGVKMRPSD